MSLQPPDDAEQAPRPAAPTSPPPRPKPRNARQLSAGGLLFRGSASAPEVCLIAKYRGRVWCLPKGRLQPGESNADAALREIAEETGHHGVVLAPLRKLHYRFYLPDENISYSKTVAYFLVRCIAEEAQPRDGEADDVAWFPAHEALLRLRYANERKMVEAGLRKLLTLSESSTGEPPPPTPSPTPLPRKDPT